MTRADEDAKVIGRRCDSLNRLGFGAVPAANTPQVQIHFWGGRGRYRRHKVLVKGVSVVPAVSIGDEVIHSHV
jgi:hypothetical protein